MKIFIRFFCMWVGAIFYHYYFTKEKVVGNAKEDAKKHKTLEMILNEYDYSRSDIEHGMRSTREPIGP
jgi:hypothetical protein